MDPYTSLTRLGITLILALVFGLNRQKAHKPVGFGTFLFVSLGSCALAIIAVSNKFENSIGLLSAIITGIGFLGAGALIKGTDKVFGFTTAASIWLFAIFGLSIGIGEYLIGAFMYGAIWLVIILDSFLERGGIGSYQKRLTIKTKKVLSEGDLKKHLQKYASNYKIVGSEVDKDKQEMTLIYVVEGHKEALNNLVKELYSEEWIRSARVE